MTTRKQSPKKRVYAWLPDLPDHRDRLFKAARIKLPSSVPILGVTNKIENQGALSSCTGNASTSALEILLGLTARSRLFAYYNARALGDPSWTSIDDGAYIRDAIKGLFKFGVPTERAWSYSPRFVNVSPTADAYRKAEPVKTQLAEGYEYARVGSLYQLKLALSQGLPVVFGFEVTAEFDNIGRGYKNVLPLPAANDELLGGHAVVAVGYDDNPPGQEPFIWVRNSWGRTWGDNGLFRMDQRWFTDSRRLVDDLWVIRKKVA